ncbi:hypothetical protein AgCh_000687 [Apium graveolens]
MGVAKCYIRKKAPDSSAPYDAEVYFETRERSDNREYKIDPAIMKSKLEKISKKLSTGNNVSELLTDGKSHGPTWLLGRCAKPSQITSSTAPKDTYVQELTTKIRQSLTDEVQEKVRQVQAEVDDQVNKKVQQNMALVLKKLAEANPNITVDIEDLCSPFSSDNNGLECLDKNKAEALAFENLNIDSDSDGEDEVNAQQMMNEETTEHTTP